MRGLSFIILCLSLLSGTAFAELHTNQWSVGAKAGAMLVAPWSSELAKNTLDPGPHGGLWLRYHHNHPHAGFELAYDFLDFSGRDLSSHAYTMTYFWRYNVLGKVQPITGVGVGLAQTKNFFTSGDRDLAVFKLRLGVEINMSHNFDLGVYADHFTLPKNKTTDAHVHAFAPSVGISYYFGEPANLTAAVAPAPAPEPTKAAAPSAGSSKDSDGDGVPDSSDRCANSPRGSSVNELGCAVKQSFEVTLDVKFRSNTATIDRGESSGVAVLAQILARNPDLKVRIEGHTDNSGDARRNKRLSQARADAVKNLLVQRFKVSEKRLQSVGYGSAKPISSNDTPEGRAVNRRVNARVIR